MGKHLGAENGDSVLGTERDQTAGTPRDTVHYSVAPCSYEYLLHLHLINHGSQVTNTVWGVCVCVCELDRGGVWLLFSSGDGG